MTYNVFGGTLNLAQSLCDRHLSYDACLEVTGEIIRTVMCCIVLINQLLVMAVCEFSYSSLQMQARG